MCYVCCDAAPVFQVYLEPDFFQSSAPVAFRVVSASPKFNTTRCSCPNHQLGEVTVPPRCGTVGVGHASRSCVYGVAVQSLYVLLL